VKREKLEAALNQISDKHITEAATAKKKHRLTWFGTLAAVLALILLLRNVEIPIAIRAEAISPAPESRVTQRPDFDDYETREQWNAAYDAWNVQRDARSKASRLALAQASDFFRAGYLQFLTGENGNQLFSPINAYIGLAMAAELTAGDTHSQLLDTLGAPDIETLRSCVSALWEEVYRDNGNEVSTLANAIWLDDTVDYRQSAMDDLAYHYYASVYRQDLSSKQAAKDIAAWLNNNTSGFLKKYTGDIVLPPEAVLALYSTIYFQSKWTDEFHAANNTVDVFHGLAGDTNCTYMNAKLWQMHYYWGKSFGAVSLPLKNGSRMWFILPDEGKTTTEVLQEGEYWDLIHSPREDWDNTKYMKVNLTVPKFDISTRTDLRSGLEEMGITDLFYLDKADFSASLNTPCYISAANQAVRVAVDEQGVTAAAYIELPGAGAAPPPEEIIDFVLDRPFLFVITTGSNIPLFAGTVNQP